MQKLYIALEVTLISKNAMKLCKQNTAPFLKAVEWQKHVGLLVLDRISFQ